MKTGWRVLRAAALGGALIASTALAPAAQAQTANPPFSQVDANGVDMVTGQFGYTVTEGSIGSGEGALTLTRDISISGPNGSDNWSGVLYWETSTLVHVAFGAIAESFSVSGST